MNDDHAVEIIDERLSGKKIAIAVTGGIAAIKIPEIVRQLRRYGAEIDIYTTPTALKFIGILALEWSSRTKPVTELGGNAEHICKHDLVVMIPATLNSINKIAHGIADNVVTALMQSAIGTSDTKIIIAPTMHISLWKNNILQDSINRLEKMGVNIMLPRLSEGKAKIPRTRSVVNYIIKLIGNNYLSDDYGMNKTQPDKKEWKTGEKLWTYNNEQKNVLFL